LPRAEEVRRDSQQCYLGGWQKKIVLIFSIANHDGCAKYAQNKLRILIFCNSLRRESSRSAACTYGDESTVCLGVLAEWFGFELFKLIVEHLFSLLERILKSPRLK
jgi:hypothetical protein